MKIAIVGHRGVGKSHFLNRLKEVYASKSDYSFFCLDRYIEKKTERLIQDIFLKNGEQYFRNLEKRFFDEICAEFENCVVALGAGFEGEIPQDCVTIWLQRKVNLRHAKFLNRPQLDGRLVMAPERFAAREKKYASQADIELVLEEHLSPGLTLAEAKFAHALLENTKLSFANYYFTPINRVQLANVRKIYDGGIEIRDDLLSLREITEMSEQGTNGNILSFRVPEKIVDTKKFCEAYRVWDWAVELGDCPWADPPILSCHTRKSTLVETLKEFSHPSSLLKLAVPILNFQELIDGYHWQQEDHHKRVFLPISDLGRWNWFRLIMSEQNAINFFRSGQSGILDQPSMVQLCQWQWSSKQFAAILGSPVDHSLTPGFHHHFFAEKNMNIVGIPLGEEEVVGAMPVLHTLGLRAAAITSPLKIKLGNYFGSSEAINTLAWSDDKDCFYTSNTDLEGLKRATENINASRVAVWGGGGTLGIVEQAFPQASFYSSRTGELKRGSGGNPDVIVWAVGKEKFDREGSYPPENWQPRVVLDLNYSSDSPGIDCAARFSCAHENGIAMFKEQAFAQQRFWSQYVGK